MTRGLRLPNKLTGGGLALLTAVTITNVLNFVFQLVAAHRLGPSSYGELGALTAALFIFAVPSSALQVAISSRVAGRLRDNKTPDAPFAFTPLLTNAVGWGLAATVALLLMAPLLTDFLQLSSSRSAVLLALYVLPTMIDIVPRGVLLGRLQFGRVASALIIGALLRLVLLIVLTPDHDVTGAMTASVAGALATAVVLLLWVRPLIAESKQAAALHVGWKMTLAALWAYTGYWVLNASDVVLARHFLDHPTSGAYTAVATTASIALFVSGVVATAAFPRFAAAGGDGPAGRAALAQSMFFSALLGAAVGLVLVLWPGNVTATLFGDAFGGTGNALAVLTLSAVTTALAMLLMQYHLSGRFVTAASTPWVGVLVVIAVVMFRHESIMQIASTKLAALVSVVLASLVLAFVRRAPEERDRTSDGKTDLHTDPAAIDITMVVPYYNPGPALRRNIENLVASLQETGLTYEIIAVSDGATDGSEKSLEGLDESIVQSVVLPVNTGKGQALRVGFTHGKGRYLGFIDADGDVDPKLVQPYLNIVQMYSPDIVLGSKRHPMSTIHYPPIRHVYSWGYQQLIRILFNLRVRDTQTGLKIIRRELLAAALPRMVEKRFAFDLELFVVARHLGFNNFFEMPIRIDHQFTSTVSRSTWMGTMLDTLAIYYRLHLLHYYDEPRHEITAEQAPVDQAETPRLPEAD